MIVCACAGLGWVGARRLYDAETRWRAWVTLLSRLHGELRYTMCPVQEALCRINKSDLTALKWLGQYTAPREELCCPTGLTADEQAFAEAVFAFLGASDLEGQLNHIEQMRDKAQELADIAAAKRQRLAPTYTAVGVCAGLCVGLVMI